MTVDDASRLLPRDLFTYAQEHRLLDDVLVSPDEMPDYHSAPIAAAAAASSSTAPVLDIGSDSVEYDMPSSSVGGGPIDKQARNPYSPPRNSPGSYSAPPSQRHITVSNDVPSSR